ncbi:MAG: DUF3857 domain-containing protein [Asticcacaulis sp.]
MLNEPMVQVRTQIAPAANDQRRLARLALTLCLCVSPLPLMAQTSQANTNEPRTAESKSKAQPQSPTGKSAPEKDDPYAPTLRTVEALGISVKNAANRVVQQASKAVSEHLANAPLPAGQRATPQPAKIASTPGPIVKPALASPPLPTSQSASVRPAKTLRTPTQVIEPARLPDAPIPYTALSPVTASQTGLAAPNGAADNLSGTVLASGLITAQGALSAVTAENARSVGSLRVTYGPIPAWTTPPPPPNTRTPPTGAPIHIIHSDTQTRIEADQVSTFTRFRARVLNRQGMMLGDLNLTWEPSANTVQVHNVTIFRNGQAIEMLPGLSFSDGQRMEGSGDVPGDFLVRSKAYVPGLEVGDELELSMTISHREPNVRHTSNGILTGRESLLPHDSRLRLTWPISLPVNWSVSRDLTVTAPTQRGSDYDLTLTVPSTPKPKLESAPPRFNVTNQVAYSAYKDWAELSAAFYPHFAAALTLDKSSPVRAEADRIRALSNDPLIQASEALALVQDKIRYVNIALNGGNIIPPRAESVLARRYGDCKGKSVLLAALLKELGIKAELVLVSTESGDSLATSLPLVAAFNHVIVRAEIAGQSFWLDGTREGDRHILTLEPNRFRHGLPLRPTGATLLAIDAQGNGRPDFSYDIVVDASGGARGAKTFHVLDIRNNYARLVTYALATATDEQKKELAKQLFSMAGNWISNRSISWAYNEPNNRLTLSMTGQGDIPVAVPSKGNYRMVLDGIALSAPPQVRHSGPADASIPILQDFPELNRATFQIRLPEAPTTGAWTADFADIDAVVDQTRYTRLVMMNAKTRTLTTRVSAQNLTPEITRTDILESAPARQAFDEGDAGVFSSINLNFNTILAEMLQSGEQAGIPKVNLLHLVYAEANQAGHTAMRELVRAQLNKEFPNSEQATLVNIQELVTQNRQEDALSLAHTALQKDSPESVIAAKIQLELELDRLSDAHATAKTGLAKYPQSSEMMSYMSLTSRLMGDYTSALTFIDRAIAKEPDALHFKMSRTDILFNLGRMAEAGVLSSQNVKSAPDEAFSLVGRADYFLANGKADLAYEDLREAQRLAPENAFVQMRFISSLILKGERNEAQAYAELMAKHDPQEYALSNLCATLLMLNTSPEAARPTCVKADTARAVKNLPSANTAYVAMLDGKTDEAAQMFDQILSVWPTDVQALYGRSLIRAKLGDGAGAEADRQSAMRTDPAIFRLFSTMWPKL